MSWLPDRLSPLRYSPMQTSGRSLADLLSPPTSPAVTIDPLAGAPHFVLSFTDLTYTVKTRSNKPKTLLNSVTGLAREGEIMSVLGASGSGKSTLIDALAGRISTLKGSVKLNGEPVNDKLLRPISAYVMQDDLLFPMLTVEETLTFAAEFRLPRTLSRSKKKARVDALMDQLGLTSAATTIIGDEGHRGVSGGKRRRVSIGTDIIHDPIVLFLDEPTSGLDSTSAFMVVSVLRRIAESGSIVIMSIHQPSARVVGAIDRMLLLSRGRTVYHGPTDGLAGYLSEFGHPVPGNENRIEFALDLIRELERDEDVGTEQLVQFNRSWQDRMSYPNFDGVVPLKGAIAASIPRGKPVAGGTTFANSPWTEMAVLARRSITNTRRMPELFAIRLGAVLVTGFILATIFWRLDDSPKGAMERLGFLAFAMSTIYYSCSEALPVFLQERYIFMRETAYNAYRRSSYVLSNAIVGLPPLVVLAFAFAVTTFFAVGLAGGGPGFIFFFSTVLASFWAGTSFVTFLSGVVPHIAIGFTIAVAIFAYYLLFSGFFISRDRIPAYWVWFHYLSLMKYPYEAVLRNEFGGASRCFTRGSQIFDNTMMKGLPEAAKARALEAIGGAIGASVGADSCVVTGADVLREEGVPGTGKWSSVWVTVAWGFLFRVLFYLALLVGSKNKRR
uniref:ABC-2 type transporter family protein n=1 Tax=Asparagus officinalis TaxID=4686 RepID=A0A5C1ZZ40_ASPOF|nr:ABC-2 type transporter family protein [Asparagus officinalis]